MSTSPPVAALLNHVRYDLFDAGDASTSVATGRDLAQARLTEDTERLKTDPPPEVTIELYGQALTVMLDPDDLPEQLARLYSIGGWPTVTQIGAQVKAEHARAPTAKEIARWTQADLDFAAARYLLAVDVIHALERIEARAISLALGAVKGAQQLALRERAHYGVEGAGGHVEHMLPTPVWIPSYRVTKDRPGLKAAVECLHALSAEVDRLRNLYLNVDDPGGAVWPMAADEMAKAQEKLTQAYADVAGGPHPFAAALAPAVTPGRVQEKLDTVLGGLLQLVIDQAKAVTAIPAATPEVFRASGGWPETLLVKGPERTLAERLAAQTDALTPVVMEEILFRLIKELRGGPAFFDCFVLIHHLDALQTVRSELASTSRAVSAAQLLATLVHMAISILALIDPRLRGAAGVLGGVLTVYSSIHALRSAMDLEQSFAAAVRRDLAESGDAAPLADLGRLLHSAPRPGSLLFELLRATVPLATLGAALARLGPQTIARLEATDLALSVL